MFLFRAVLSVVFLSLGMETFARDKDTNDECPKTIECASSVTPESCPNNTVYRERVTLHGCCPGCVRHGVGKEGEKCDVPANCQPGLTCTKGTCREDPLQACEYYRRYNKIYKKTRYWEPACLPDGSFAPKQCKGEKMFGKCFCTDPRGNRIFGEEDWFKAENMTCGCSRLRHQLEAISPNVSLHCDHLGNFERLQCDRGVCWCAHRATGFPYTALVPVEMMKALPCYRRIDVGMQYYRKCDSEYQAQVAARNLLRNHGTDSIALHAVNCNYDGSYHRVQQVKGRTRCVYLDNSPITEPVSMATANCNCAYDGHVHTLQRSTFSFDCQPNGDYVTRQTWEGQVYCVDSDGFIYSNDPKDCPLSGSLAKPGGRPQNG